MNSGILMIVDSENDHFTKWCNNLKEVLGTIKEVQALSPSFIPKEHVRLIVGTEAYIKSCDDGICISMENSNE